MSNGTAAVFSLSVLAIALAGCDREAPSPVAPTVVAAMQGGAPSMRKQVDQVRNRVWLLTEEGVFFHDATAGRTAVVLPGWQWVGTQFACLPDLALGPKGEALITSNVVPTLWKVDPDSLAVTVHPLALDSDLDKDVGFTALAYLPEQRGLFAASGPHGSLWRIDPLLRTAQKILLPEAIANACELGPRSVASSRKTYRFAGLCARSAQDAWAIDLAPDRRSAYMRAPSWSDCPEPLSSISLRGE